jgi:hypothetical protein
MIPRLLNFQGIAGIAAALALLSLLLVQKLETRHWRKQSGQYEQLYYGERAASAQTVANYRAATEAARAADAAAAERVRAEQHVINERIANDYETRLAAARDRFERLRIAAGSPATDSRGCGASAVPALSAAPCGIAQAADQDRLPAADALIATEQALQLDELIRWTRAQAVVDPNPSVDRDQRHASNAASDALGSRARRQSNVRIRPD